MGMPKRKTCRRRRRKGSTSLIQQGINILIVLAIAAVVFTLVVGIGSQVLQNVPAPQSGTLLYNLTTTFNKAISSGAPLLGPLILVGIGILVMAGIAYIWALFGGGGGGRIGR